ncbi:MAG: PD40 domain-containing protein [Acidobacteriia bacterium]|nr:PD40 domain-containing protein [Terriglobia bacterium]
MTGKRVSHFEVLEKLGEGGMGVVYHARDVTLNRPVAIKLLHPEKVANAERRQRFIQEARAASALNHPNIITVYEVGEHDGAQFIAMEFVAGHTLDHLMGRRPMWLSEALNYAAQMADGLACAHNAGIVHRDFKPANVMVGDDGRVRILDFGLAKLTEPLPGSSGESGATLTAVAAPLTEEGTLLGTVAYMSPEQAEARVIDARSDIFSFGAVFYEMLSGQRAFQGKGRIGTLSAVVREEPKPLSQLRPNIPVDLEKLVARCLRKDRERRAQHMSDIKLAIQEVREEVESGHGLPAVSAAKRPRWLLPILGAGLISVTAAIGILWRGNKTQPEEPLKTSILTSYPGSESSPALSPDGKQLAFTWNGEKEDNYDIYVKLVDAGTPVRLTTSPDFDGAPSWSPDGRFLAFVRSGRTDHAYYVIPALGGPERKVADIPRRVSLRSFPQADWSPDGKSLVIVDSSADPASLALVSVESGEKQKLTPPPANSWGDGQPRVSPDGRWLAFTREENVNAGDWFIQPWGSDSSPKPITRLHANVIGGGGAWTVDSGALVLGIRGQLQRVSISGPVSGMDTPRPLPGVGSDAYSPSIGRTGGRLAYHHGYSDSNLWRMDLNTPGAEPTRIIASTMLEHQPDYSPDGSRIAFISSRSGEHEVWIANSDGSNPVQLTNGAANPTAPRWSPDGRRIAFAKRPGGNTDIYVVDAQGGVPKRLTTDPANDATAYWSRDGKWIYFASNRTGRNEVWKIAAAGGSPEVQVTRNGGWRSRESADGTILYFQKFDTVGLWQMPVAGGTEKKIADTPMLQPWDMAGANSIVYFGSGRTLHRLDLATLRDTVIKPLPERTSGGTSNMTVSPDGRWMVFVRVDQVISDLMLVEGFR